MQSGLHIDYVFLDTEERKMFFKKDIPMNDCYRIYGNFAILFSKEKVGDIKYSSFKHFNLSKVT
jgi:hypothetical protein